MQNDARNRAVSGAVASLISAAAMDYSQQLLQGTASATSFTPTGTHTVGDFSGTIVAGTASGTYVATVTGATDSGYTTALGTTWATKSFRLY